MVQSLRLQHVLRPSLLVVARPETGGYSLVARTLQYGSGSEVVSIPKPLSRDTLTLCGLYAFCQPPAHRFSAKIAIALAVLIACS